MQTFGKLSAEKLKTCHEDIQQVMREAIKNFSFFIIRGYDPPEKQFELFKKGRKLVNGVWIIDDKNKIVTNCDGYKKLSHHNYLPSLAIDCAPDPVDWKNINQFQKMAEVILKISEQLKINLEWGGNWQTFKDYPHFQLKLKLKK